MWCADLPIKKRRIQNIDFKLPSPHDAKYCHLEDSYKHKIREQFNEEELIEEALELLKKSKGIGK